VLLATMTVAAGIFGGLYVTGSAELADVRAAAQSTTEGRRQAEDDRDKAKDRADAAEATLADAKAAAKDLRACRQVSRDLLAALKGDSTTQAVTDALNRMAGACQ
jgi:hypothetical protein